MESKGLQKLLKSGLTDKCLELLKKNSAKNELEPSAGRSVNKNNKKSACNLSASYRGLQRNASSSREKNLKLRFENERLVSSNHETKGENFKEVMQSYKEKIQQNQIRLDKIKNKMKSDPYEEKELQQSQKKSTSSTRLDTKQQQNGSQIFDEYSELFKYESLNSLAKMKGESEKIGEELEQKKDINMSLLFNGREQNFTVIRFIDEGSTGKVFLVKHFATGLIMCLKIIKKTSLPEECFMNFIQQIKIQSAMNNPNILNIYGYTADAQKIYLLLEPCLGSNIYKKLSKEAFKEKDVKKYVKELCSAIEYMHKKDVIHRDIKAENILLHENMVKVCDFGWAVYAPMLRNTQCGTPLYTPPEIVKHQYYDSKVDIWSIGVLTYEMLYGVGPFQIRHPDDLIKIVEEEIFFSKEVKITETARDFIGKCLQKNPKKRMNIRQALEHDFLTTRLDHFRHTMA